jgi:hypothetical protein
MTLRSWIRRHATLHKVVHATWCRAVAPFDTKRAVSSTGGSIFPTPPPVVPFPPSLPSSIGYIRSDAARRVATLLSPQDAEAVFHVQSSSHLLALFALQSPDTLAQIDMGATYQAFSYNVGSYSIYLTATDDDGNSLRYPN